MQQRGFAPVILVLVLALLSVGLAYFYGVKQGKQSLPIAVVSPSPKSIVCTQDALQCPDGNYVGRTGPNCEFAACPSPSGQLKKDSNQNNLSVWKGLGVSFQYPSNWKIAEPVSNVQKPQTGGFYQQSFGEKNISLHLHLRPLEQGSDGSYKSLKESYSSFILEDVILDGRPAIKTVTSDTKELYTATVATTYDNITRVSLQLFVQPADKTSVQKAKEDFQAIISSFKFN